MSLIGRLLFKTNRKCLRKFIINMGWKGMRSFRKFQKRKKRGEMFPAFQFISVTNDCNLHCQGCWVTKNNQADHLEISTVNKIIADSKRKGSYFFGILGGEPLMYKPLFEIFERNQDSYFQLFTNGTMLNDDIASRLKKVGNVTPLISFEGNENVADVRRGGKNIYSKTLKAIETCKKHKLITGVAMSVCKSNIEMATSDEFVNMVWNSGAIYLWYYIYRPSGSDPCYDLALSPKEVEKLRRFMVEARTRFSIIIIDSYWGAKGEPFCPAIEGLSHHINPAGYIEPCPVLQFSKDKLNGQDLDNIYENSEFLKDFKKETASITNGCILMENPKWLKEFIMKNDAINTSNREIFVEKLDLNPSICSHGSCPRIPEKKWAYRFAKKHAFFGLGAYG